MASQSPIGSGCGKRADESRNHTIVELPEEDKVNLSYDRKHRIQYYKATALLQYNIDRARMLSVRKNIYFSQNWAMLYGEAIIALLLCRSVYLFIAKNNNQIEIEVMLLFSGDSPYFTESFLFCNS